MNRARAFVNRAGDGFRARFAPLRARRRERPVRPRRWLRWAGVVLAVLVTVSGLVINGRLYRSSQTTTAVVAQLHHLRDELRAGAGEDMQAMFPEGYVFTHVLYGMTWIDIALQSPERADEALRESRWALDRLESPEGREPFSASLTPAHGVFYVGWLNHLRGRIVELAGPEAPEAERFQADCEVLAEAFGRDGPFLDAYPGEAWPVDSVVAVSTLALHDRLLPARFGSTIETWVAEAESELDDEIRLLPHRVRPQVEPPRGSSQALIHRFLPEIDPVWAGAQYERYRDEFVVTRLGQPGIREHPAGHGGSGDVDSGPLVLGVSLSATVVSVGAARVHGDDALAGPLTGLGEALGMPLHLGGSKRYAFGLLPVGDAFLAWSAAARPHDAVATTDRPDVVAWWWRLPWHALTVVVLAGVWTPFALPVIRRARLARQATAPTGHGPVTDESDEEGRRRACDVGG